MTKHVKLLSSLFILTFIFSCASLGGSGKKNWTAQEKSEFSIDCKANAAKLMSESEANAYCSCAIKKVEKAYDSYAAAKKASLSELRKVAKSCE